MRLTGTIKPFRRIRVNIDVRLLWRDSVTLYIKRIVL